MRYALGYPWHSLQLVWLVCIHLLFVAVAAIYLALLRGYTVRSTDDGTQSLPTDVYSFVRALVRPVPLMTPNSIPADKLPQLIHECNQDGTPLQCWRDNCRGHYLLPRMRHCGTCGECRFMLDHHCVWVSTL